MSAAHTPGPWELFTAKCMDGTDSVGIKSTRTGACVGFPEGPTASEKAANAQVQMLAPRMLEACQFMLANAFEQKWAGDEQAFNMLSRIVKAAGAAS